MSGRSNVFAQHSTYSQRLSATIINEMIVTSGRTYYSLTNDCITDERASKSRYRYSGE